MSAIGAIGLTLRTLFGRDDDYSMDDGSEESVLDGVKAAIKDKLISVKQAAELIQVDRSTNKRGAIISEGPIRDAKNGSNSSSGGGSSIKNYTPKEVEPVLKETKERSSDDGRGIE